MRRRILAILTRVLTGLVLIGAVYLVYVNRQELVDRWNLVGYKPSDEIVALADSATMEGRGRDLFYASDPKVNEREAFNANCTDTGEESLVLGCYTAQRIYIYNVTDERLKGVKEVTAAHEMLHAAYERLSGADRNRVDDLLRTELARIKNARLNELIDLYNKHEPGQLLNEMHSILGTEFPDLSDELEEYYKQYFKNRAKVVAMANAYESVFVESQNRIDGYDKQLADIKRQIEANSTELDTRLADLNTQSSQLDALRNVDPIAYNNAVPGYNASVRAYNALAERTRGLVNQYNGLVQSRNSEVAAQNDLYNSLDSNYQEVSSGR